MAKIFRTSETQSNEALPEKQEKVVVEKVPFVERLTEDDSVLLELYTDYRTKPSKRVLSKIYKIHNRRCSNTMQDENCHSCVAHVINCTKSYLLSRGAEI